MTIAEKYAQQYQPNGEVSLADLIQAAVDEAIEVRRHEVAMHAVQQIKAEIGQSVAVVEEPVAWVWAGARLTAKEVPGSTVPLFRKPTHSITSTELATLRAQAETHAMELRAYEATVQNLEERIRQLEKEWVPDMFWSAENPEEGGLHASEIAENLADNLDHGESADFDILCAKKYPTQTMRVSVSDDGKGVDWKWIAAAPAQEKE